MDNSHPSQKEWLLTKSAIGITEKPVDDEENKNGGQASATEFPSADTSNYAFETVIHNKLFF